MIKFNALIPELIVSNIEKSLGFYLNTLSFKLEYDRKEDKFAFLSLEESQIMIVERNGNWETGDLIYPYGRGINIQIATKNIDELYRNIQQNNYPIKIEIQENWYKAGNMLVGHKEFLVLDPDGYLLRFAQGIGKKEVSVKK